jgi:hypothetical protein
LVEGEPCRLSTENGTTIRARTAVVAPTTRYSTGPDVHAAVPHRELVVAAPIPADHDPGGMYITPDHNTRSVRTAPYADGNGC